MIVMENLRNLNLFDVKVVFRYKLELRNLEIWIFSDREILSRIPTNNSERS